MRRKSLTVKQISSLITEDATIIGSDLDGAFIDGLVESGLVYDRVINESIANGVISEAIDDPIIIRLRKRGVDDYGRYLPDDVVGPVHPQYSWADNAQRRDATQPATEMRATVIEADHVADMGHYILVGIGRSNRAGLQSSITRYTKWRPSKDRIKAHPDFWRKVPLAMPSPSRRGRRQFAKVPLFQKIMTINKVNIESIE